MNLHEEYNMRHSLRAPVIRRMEGRAYLLYRANKDVYLKNWVILQIASKKDAYAPASYTLTWQTPRANGISQGNFLDTIFEAKVVQWDEYEVEILDVSRRKDLTALKNPLEAKLAVWEMYLYGMDDKLSSCGPNTRLKILRSLDTDLSVEERIVAQDDVIQTMMLQNRDLSSRWDSLRIYYDPKTYADWLADIATRMHDKTYSQDFGDLQSVA